MPTIEIPYKFRLRPYQEAVNNFMVSETEMGRKEGDIRAGKRAMTVWHRRSGKDKTFFASQVVPAMLERVGIYHYYFPTMADGRKILWNGIDRNGFPFLNHLPVELVAKKNANDMFIELKNGSILQIIGSDRMESVGTNPVGCVFSEFSKQNPKWWDMVRPILAENGGWAMFNFTPRGKNHAYRMYRRVAENPRWFTETLTVDDTHAIPYEMIEEDRQSGMSEELIQQEYFCSFDIGVEGSYYGTLMAKVWEDGRVCNVPHDDNTMVYTAWDLGYGDSTSIWFYQKCGLETHLIDYYENSGEGMAHYSKMLHEKKEERGFVYGAHFAPHDIKNGNMATGVTLQETAAEFGIIFDDLPRERDVTNGIERVRKLLPRCWFDMERCKAGVDALENYKKKYNDKMEVFSAKPEHNWASHPSDAFRYLSAAIEESHGSHIRPASYYKGLREKYACA